MNIVMAGLDYRSASIETREKAGFNQSKVREILAGIKKYDCVSGAVVISTCNRTEVYISFRQYEEADPVEIFCNAAGLDDGLKKYFYVKKGESAAVYLFELACGIHSMIFGEDQIISQVKEAIHAANEEKASDAKLNTLFRCAITCAKKVKTKIMLTAISPSVAAQAVLLVSEYLSKNQNSKALVIGNGAVGRKVCEDLIAKGCGVYMTTRKHNSDSTIIPKGCKTVAYEDRAAMISNVDILISATSSPHQTITYEMMDTCEIKPKYVIDLAVPRDIDPRIGSMKDIFYYNIDHLGAAARKDNSKEINAVRNFIQDHIMDYNKWYTFRERLLVEL